MDEKILLRSESVSKKKLFSISFIPGLILLLLATFFELLGQTNTGDYSTYFQMSFTLFIVGGIVVVIGAILYFCWASVELTVGNERVYGIAKFGIRVDLPMDSISAVGTSFLKGIDIGSSSGRIHFKFIENNEEIHSCISKLIMERQQKPQATTTTTINQPASNADELQKYKNLLDNGVITQEEFDAKKKQLLGL